MNRRMAVAAIGLLVLLGVVSLTGRRRIMDPGPNHIPRQGEVLDKDEASQVEAAGRVAAAASGNAQEASDEPVAAPVSATAGSFRLPADAMLVRSGTAVVEVDSLATALEHSRDLATRLGGFVAGTDARAGRGQSRTATLELRVPSDRFDELARDLAAVGKLERVQITTQDVGEEYTDVAARVANGKRMEARLLDLLATRTGRLSDVLAMEGELARVREEIERYEARLRYLQARTSMSRLTLSMHEPLPLLAEAGPAPLRDAARQAWRNFIELVAFAIASLGVLAPLGMLAGGAWWLWRRHRPALI